MTKIHKLMLNLYSTISLLNITNDFMVALHSNIKTEGDTILDSSYVIKFKIERK